LAYSLDVVRYAFKNKTGRIENNQKEMQRVGSRTFSFLQQGKDKAVETRREKELQK